MDANKEIPPEFQETRRTAEEFIDSLGRNFPIQCGSDEFIFFPRALSCRSPKTPVENLDPESIKDHLRYARDVMNRLDQFLSNASGPGSAPISISRRLAAGFIREYGEREIWRRDPCLYPRIFMLALERYLDSAAETFLPDEWIAALESLLAQGVMNLDPDRMFGVRIALEMCGEIHNLLHHHQPSLGFGFLMRLHRAMEAYVMNVESMSLNLPGPVDPGCLVQVLDESWGLSMGGELLCRVADQEEKKARSEVERIGAEITGGESWLIKYTAHIPARLEKLGVPGVYEAEARDLEKFFSDGLWVPVPGDQNLEIRETPEYIRPLRASASYSAPPPFRSSGNGVFFITPGPEQSPGVPDLSTHREYMFVTAHETVPGHHLLDGIRLGLQDPILSQIESAMFYEGWAAYAESLLVESGYTVDPFQKLIGAKRQLWRTLRAQADLDLNIRNLPPRDAALRFREIGIPAATALGMVEKYARTPGYQLCYVLGRRALGGLRDRFRHLGPREFHDRVLAAGQVPFSDLEPVLAAISKGI